LSSVVLSSTEYNYNRDKKFYLYFLVKEKEEFTKVIPVTIGKKDMHEDRKEATRYPPSPKPKNLKVSCLENMLS
jgi:hypothetical protein